MTYSILARCARTGQLGLAVASYSVAIGLYSDGAVRPNVGATFTQGNANPRNNRLALALLAQGHGPQHALRELAGSDPDFDYRQVGIVDREGRAQAHSGAMLHAWTGHRAGLGYVALGEGLAGAQVLDAMAAAFGAEPQADLDARMLRALEAGRDAGGLAGKAGRLPERSAALVVWGARDVSDLDLRVDLHDKAIDDLRRIYADTKPTVAYYDERARDPRNAISGSEFTERLKQRRAQEGA
jgi:uncharacterized Ntn-hydrolase superfamily protein